MEEPFCWCRLPRPRVNPSPLQSSAVGRGCPSPPSEEPIFAQASTAKPPEKNRATGKHSPTASSERRSPALPLGCLGSALRRAENFGFIDKNPVPAVKLPKAASTEREVFSLDEIYQLIAAAPNEDWQTLILVGFYTGARLSDCARLTCVLDAAFEGTATVVDPSARGFPGSTSQRGSRPRIHPGCGDGRKRIAFDP